MRVLLGGASGAIGRQLVPLLLNAGHTVIGLTRTPGSVAATGAKEVVVDILDRDALLAAVADIKADAVMHQATALRKTPASFRDMRATNRLRTEGTSALLAAARLVGAKKFIAASFFGGYGLRDFGRTPLDESAHFGEADEHNPKNDAVLIALRSLEQQTRAFGGVVLRYGLFYDSIATTVSPVSRSWTGVLPMLHVEDAAAAAVLALTKGKPGKVYNVADDSPMSYRNREIARASAAGLKPPTQLPDSVLRIAAPFGAQLLTATRVELSTEAIRKELGWAPKYPSLVDGLAKQPARALVAVGGTASVSTATAPIPVTPIAARTSTEFDGTVAS
jgi:nucleoside-diphosphate-sugar epimerase